jgi:hypothetical protein
LQLRDRTDSKLVVECLDLFRAEPGKENNSRIPAEIRAQFLEIFKRPGFGQLLDLQRDAFSNSRNFRDGFFVLKVRYIRAECFDRARCIRIRRILNGFSAFNSRSVAICSRTPAISPWSSPRRLT